MKLIARIKAIGKILISDHVIIIEVGNRQLSRFLEEKSYIVNTHSTLAKYPTDAIVKDLADVINDDELVLEKAAFWGEVIYNQTQNESKENKA